MELDELKILIKEKPAMQGSLKSPGEFAALLSKKTQSITAKLKRSLWIELIACIVFTIMLLLAGIIGKYSSLRIYFSVFAIVCFLFIPVLFFLIKKTNQLGSSVLPVKSNLSALSKILDQYVKIYFRFTMAIIPVCILFSFSLGYNDERLHNPNFNQSLSASLTKTSAVIIFLAAYFIVFSAGMYYLSKWYLKKLYGNYLVQLQSLIKELEE